jgi:hypothetical protein
MKNYIVGILSCKSCETRIKGCRLSWASHLASGGHPHVFIIGDPSLKEEYRAQGDVLQVRCPDDYESVVFKTHYFCKWAVQTREFEYLFKCDDDSYINVKEFARFDAAGRDFIGHRLYLPAVGYYPSGGAGYLLSRKAAELVASKDFYEYICGDHAKRPEDVMVALFLSRHGIALSPENSIFNHMRCRIFGKWITCHHITEEADFRTPIAFLPWRLYVQLRVKTVKQYFSKTVLFLQGLFKKGAA